MSHWHDEDYEFLAEQVEEAFRAGYAAGEKDSQDVYWTADCRGVEEHLKEFLK